jgi:hypothetical protein
MTDISALGIKITSSGVVKTIKELQDFSKAASEVRRQASKPIDVKLGNTGIAKAIGEIDRLRKALSGVTGKDLSGTVQLAQAMSKIEIANNKAAISAQKLAQEVARTEVAQSRAAAAASNLAAANAKADVSLAKTAISAQKLASAQEAAAFASNASMNQIKNNLTAMNLAANSMKQADAHVHAYRNSLNSIAPAAQKAGDSVQKMNAKMNDSVNNMQATPGNIAAQFQDIGVTAAMGMSPLLVALQQGTQLSSAFAGSGLKQLGAAFKQLISPVSLLTIGIVGLIAYLIQLAVEFATSASGAGKLQTALDNAKLSTNAFGDAQSILGGILDLTTGKVKDQSDAFVALARAQTAQEKIQAQIRQQEANSALKDLSREKTFIGGGPMGLEITRGYEYAAGVIDTFRSGGYSGDSGKNADAAIKQLERMLELGQLTKEEYLSAAQAVSNYSVETENIKTYDRLADAINGDTEAIKGFLNESKKKDKASERLAERLAREAEATETLIKGNYASAEAYRSSTAEGIKAAVAAEAAAKGIKARGEAAAYSARELRKWASEQARSAEENNASLREQINIQQTVNKAVASGALSVENATIAVQNMIEQRKILNAIQVAKLNGDAKGEEALRKALKELTDQQIAYNAAVREAADLSATNDVNKNIAQIQKEIDLEKRLSDERIKALRGLTGDALENELARINDERERGAILLEYEAKIADASAAGHYKLVEALEAERKKRLELLGIQQGSAKEERTFEQNRRLTLNLTNDVANLIGGKLGDTFSRLIQVLDEAFTDLAADLGEKFGHIFKAFSEGMKTGGAFGALTGSRTGGAIGGGLGQVLGEEFLTKGLESISKGLGKFAGPLGAIAGGILGGIIGGMVKSTPRASATVSIIAGEAMETAVKGSSGKLKAIAGGMADSLITGLAEIADALGAEITGNAAVSVGMRNGKYRVDTTGSGITKTSKGAVDFGKDGEAQAIAFAIQDAIKDGVLGGLSESLNRLITADGDIQTNLSKALSFKDVFDELWERTDPLGFALDKLSREQAALTKIFDQAGATVEEYAKLEELFTLKRADAVKENTAAAEAEEKAADIARQRREMEITLMELQGKSAEALAASRALELESLDATLRPLQERIYAEQDLANAAAEAAEAQRIAAANYAASTAIARGVYADRRKMDIEVMELTGNAAGALAAQRTLELEAMHPANRALQEYIWTLQDAAKEAAKAAEIAKTKRGLEIQLQEAMGNSAAAIQMQRDDILAGLDPSLRALQQQVWAEQDLAEARKSAADAAKETTDAEKDRLAGMYEALNALRSAHNEQVDALNKTADAWMDTARKLIAFRDGVLMGAANDNGMAGSRAAFLRAKVSGDTDAFMSAGSAYLDSARNSAGSYRQYQDAIAEVVGSTNGMIGGAFSQAGSAYEEVTKLNAQFAEMSAAIIASYEGQTEEVLPMFAATVTASMDTVAHQIEASGQKAAQAQATAQTALEAVAIAVNRMERVISSWDGGGAARVMTDDDTPLVTVAA